MSRFFFDSSALAKRYLEERGTARVLGLVGKSSGGIVSQLAWVEVTSAAVRHAREGIISNELLQRILYTLNNDFEKLFHVVDLESPVINRSVHLVRICGLRAADAIQLACALSVAGREASTRELVLVSADADLNKAAEQEGLQVLDPTA